MVRYYGWYSNKMRGERRKQEELAATNEGKTSIPEEFEMVDVSDYKPRRIPSPSLTGVHQEELGG